MTRKTGNKVAPINEEYHIQSAEVSDQLKALEKRLSTMETHATKELLVIKGIYVSVHEDKLLSDGDRLKILSLYQVLNDLVAMLGRGK